jgi:hypothetical protein
MKRREGATRKWIGRLEDNRRKGRAATKTGRGRKAETQKANIKTPRTSFFATKAIQRILFYTKYNYILVYMFLPYISLFCMSIHFNLFSPSCRNLFARLFVWFILLCIFLHSLVFTFRISYRQFYFLLRETFAVYNIAFFLCKFCLQFNFCKKRLTATGW